MNDLKKTAIITYYYQSINYGGNLQAYALCKKLNDMGSDAEQLCFDARGESIKSGSLSQRIKRLLRKVKRLFLKKENTGFNKEVFTKREKAFYNFNSVLTPHSKDVYTRDTIKNCADNYDIFITGSDQVWNPNWYVPAYFLDFVSSPQKKVSYATSFGVSNFTEEQKSVIKAHLSDFSMISLRENSVLEDDEVFPVQPEVLVDPTLLLSKKEWESLCLDCPVKEDYVFCYFFGDFEKSRELAKKYALENNLKLVSIPHLNGYNPNDVGLADEEFIDASPEMFITLIKNAKCVFTDSFHAVVFSGILEKEYFVFERSANDTMKSRIYSITKLFHSEDRFLNGDESVNIEYIRSLSPIDYSRENSELKQMKEKSFSYLERILQL